MTTKTQKAAQAEAREDLRTWLKPGQTVYCVLRHRARSGLSTVIDLKVVDGSGELYSIGYSAAVAMGDRYDHGRGGIKVGARVMDMGLDLGFALVYNLGSVLWPKGTDKPHGTRNGEPGRSGGYALKSEWV